ncbi:MAG: hypothetical protein IKB65_06895 [Ruminiclostridium sp.]|nr:hypothetical protein [Ruminiclostridium sp.]
MSKLNIYIDGTWLFKVVDGSVFDRFLVYPRYFSIDFKKSNDLMLKHVSKYHPECTELGNCYFVTSLFNAPADFDSWVGKQITNPYGDQSITVTQRNIDLTKQNIATREGFANAAIAAGYDANCIFHIDLQEWMLLNLIHPELRYQEKQVDTTVVALLVRDAIEHPDDCFALVAGDSDILPAIQVAYPNYTKNVFPVLTSPNERDGRNRQTSFKYSQYKFDIDTLVLQNHVGDIMAGNVYMCTECHKYFTTLNPIDPQRISSGAVLPRCKNCR